MIGKFPGVSISVEKDAKGPPAGYPVTIEITGKDYLGLIQTAETMKEYLNRVNISGVEELKINVNKNKPGLELTVDRQKAGELGVSAAQVGQLLRTSLFGSKAGVFKKDGDDYDINVRFNEANRYDNNALFNQNIIFRDPANGQIKEIPVSSLIEQEKKNSFSAIKHRQLNRVVTLYSSVLAGYNANAAVTVANTTGGANTLAANSTVSAGKVTALTANGTIIRGYTAAPAVTIAAPALIIFNGNTAVTPNNTTGAFIAISTANSFLAVGDKVVYAGNATSTPATLTDMRPYYVSFANTSGIKLSDEPNTANINFAKASGNGTTAGGATLRGETATATAVLTGRGYIDGAAHTGWVLRTVGTGGRAGRVQFETLVAMGGNFSTDASDDAILPDA